MAFFVVWDSRPISVVTKSGSVLLALVMSMK